MGSRLHHCYTISSRLKSYPRSTTHHFLHSWLSFSRRKTTNYNSILHSWLSFPRRKTASCKSMSSVTASDNLSVSLQEKNFTLSEVNFQFSFSILFNFNPRCGSHWTERAPRRRTTQQRQRVTSHSPSSTGTSSSCSACSSSSSPSSAWSGWSWPGWCRRRQRWSSTGTIGFLRLSEPILQHRSEDDFGGKGVASESSLSWLILA